MELLVAGVITAFVLGSLSMSLGQLARARNTGKLRFDAHIRADAALNTMRKDIASIVRSDDLFFSRFLLTDDTARAGGETFDRDEVLLFNTRIRPLRNIDFSGEGFEYETQYRIADDDFGPVLWVRHDAMPDEYPAGGGQVKPLVEGILGLAIEAYDGYAWYEQWDSDAEGLPLAVRVTVVASGHRGEDDVLAAPRAILRTVISIDRVLVPRDQAKHDRELVEGVTPDEDTAQPAPDESGAENGENVIIAPDGTVIHMPDDPNQRPRTRGGGQSPRSEQ
ncbi:MAG: type II secretion system protein GspJ [Phycisphaerales bacterium]|nr:type II secretion system protein GspJ [Phycisphaerales bacterium]MCI0629111.1 type II secretion system protein GspJ [Phycisphaerales bacterium]MCI0675189.1 type II secretion system protein GspJ [Phycisphaerales bacterium]